MKFSSVLGIHVGVAQKGAVITRFENTMRVSRLEIFGFKSFMERLVLPIKDGVTGVVGPNGCGKSNIVDALRWVLGETNARSLRGGLLEDVIFNGTDKLRPLGLAEVSLTVSSDGESLFDDIIGNSREGELQSQLDEAEAHIEEVSQQLKKVQRITADDSDWVTQEAEGEAAPETRNTEHDQSAESSASDNDEGAPKLRVLSPGDSFSEDDSLSDEEITADELGAQHYSSTLSAGVSEQVLQQKFGWLKSVSEVQVTRRLYRSGEAEFFLNKTPCRLRDLKEFFRVIGISARTFTIVAQGEVSRIVTAKPEHRRQIFEEAAGVLGLRDKIAASERRLKDTADNIARLEDIEREIERQVNSLKRQASRARRRESLKHELYESESSLFREKLRRVSARKRELSEVVATLEEREQKILSTTSGASGEEEVLRGELLATELLVEQLREQLDALKEEVNVRGRKEESLKGAQHELKMLFEAKGTEGKRVVERLNTLLDRKNQSQQRMGTLSAKEESLSQKLRELEVSGVDRLQQLDEEVRELRKSIRGREEQSQGLRDVLRKVEGELDATRKQMREQARPEVLNHDESQKLESLIRSIEGDMPRVFAELFEVEPEYTKAIQAAIGERASYFVASRAADLAEVLGEYSEQRQEALDESGFWYGLLQGALEENQSSGEPVIEQEVEVPLNAMPAMSVVTAEPLAQSLLGSLLSRVFIVPSFAEGLQLFRSAAIPPASLVVTRAGQCISPESISVPQKERGLLDIQQEISQLVQRKEDMELQFSGLEQQIMAERQTLTEREEELGKALRQKQEHEQAVREMSKELGSIKGYLSAEQQALEQVEHDIIRSREYEVELQNRVQELEQRRETVESELAELLKSDASGLHTNLRELVEQLNSKDSERRSLRERFEEARGQAEVERRELESLRQTLATRKLELERGSMEIEHIHESIQERLPEEYQDRVLDHEGEQIEADGIGDHALEDLEEQVRNIRAQLLREGEVDPSSIERFEEESKRLDDLKAQKSDLEAASLTLRKTVQLLREQSVERFRVTFESVREHFIKLMPRVFGGGSADLELTNDDDPLEAGIMITVRPPGKKPKSLDLLSGGEKALCATALIVSLFLVRPSPLCVLDEVDAPLDEANLVRFLSLVKEMSSETQFLLITHNKASMSAADRLVGVTMQRPGSSSVLQVSLEEAYAHVA